jgi:amidase
MDVPFWSRRSLAVSCCVAHVVLLVPGTASAATCPYRAGGVDVTTATIPQLRAALAAGRVSSVLLTRTYLARIAAVNDAGPHLHVVIMTAPDALMQARSADMARASGVNLGPLAGIPILLKDNLDTFDMPTTAGAKAMLGPPPPTDAFVAARLRNAGAVILGKTNMSEWATSISKRAGLSFSDVGGRLHNPFDGGDTSGSSNGSAIAATASLAAATVGSETQGSITLPSFVNSAVGIKPTYGLTSSGGVIPLVPTFDVVGPIARDVTDAALMLGLMTGVDPRDPATAEQEGHVTTDFTRYLRRGALRGARIGIPRPIADDPSARVTGLRQISKVLRAAGATLVPMPGKLFVGLPPANGVYGEFKSSLNEYLHARGPRSPRESLADVVAFNREHGKQAVRFGQEFLLEAEKVDEAGQSRAFRQLESYREKAHAAIDAAMDGQDVDAILAPRLVAAVTATSAGHPAVTVPAGYDGRHPFGAIFVGRRFSEPQLIGYAYAFERLTHAHRSPAEISPRFAAACKR